MQTLLHKLTDLIHSCGESTLDVLEKALTALDDQKSEASVIEMRC